MARTVHVHIHGSISTADSGKWEEAKHPRAPDGKFGSGGGDPQPGETGYSEFKQYGKYLRKGERIRTPYGATETVLSHVGAEVKTVQGNSYHPTKVARVVEGRAPDAAKEKPGHGGKGAGALLDPGFAKLMDPGQKALSGAKKK